MYFPDDLWKEIKSYLLMPRLEFYNKITKKNIKIHKEIKFINEVFEDNSDFLTSRFIPFSVNNFTKLNWLQYTTYIKKFFFPYHTTVIKKNLSNNEPIVFDNIFNYHLINIINSV